MKKLFLLSLLLVLPTIVNAQSKYKLVVTNHIQKVNYTYYPNSDGWYEQGGFSIKCISGVVIMFYNNVSTSSTTNPNLTCKYVLIK